MSLRESFPQNRKITYPIIKDKKVTYSNLSHLNYEEREHVFEKIPLKSYKKCLSYIFFGKDSKIHKSLTKASKRCFHNSQCSFYSNVFQYSGWSHQGLLEICFHINKSHKFLSEYQIYHLLKLQDIHQISCEFQECLMSP